MKKVFFIIFLCCAAVANALQISLEQKTRLEERRNTWGVRGSYSKDAFKTKTFTLKITTMSPVDVVAIFFASVGGEIYSEVLSDEVTRQKPLIFEYSGSASSNTSNYAASGIKSRSGNSRIHACVFVYDKKSGKFLGQKYTSKNFADDMKKIYENEMISVVNKMKNMNQAG